MASKPIPVLFDWDYTRFVGNATIEDGKVTIVVDEADLVSQIETAGVAGTIRAINVGIHVKYDIPMPGDSNDSS